MAEYSRMAKGSYTVTTGTLGTTAPSAKIINLPFKPDFVELINLTQAVTPTQHGIPFAYFDAAAAPVVVSAKNFDTIVQVFNSTPVLTTDSVLQGTGISVFSAGQLLQYGPLQGHNQGAITDFSITAASPAVVSATGHGLTTGNVIIFENLFQTATTGMQQMAGIPLTVTVVNANSFSVNWNASGSNYTAFNTATSTGNVGTYKQVLYPYLYAPNQAVITAINTTTSVITTAAAHNFSIGQEIAFRISQPWGSTQLNALPDILIPGQPTYWYVTAITQNTFTVGLNTLGQTLAQANITAFTSNVPFAGARTPPQAIAVGDINSGGVQYSGSALYPSPLVFNGAGTVQVPTINGPAIQGSFINATSQGFIIGAGPSRSDTSSFVGGSTNDIIEWRAYFHDLAIP